MIGAFALFLSGISSLQPCCVALQHNIQELRLLDQRRAINKSVLHLFSQRLHTGVTASSSGALPYSYEFLPRTLTQNVQPRTKLFRDRYRRRIHARCLPPDEAQWVTY